MQARQLPARHGALWLLAGFRLFRRNPPFLTALTFAYLAAVIFVNVLPLLGPLILPVILPMLTVIVANGCRAVDLGAPPRVSGLLAGLRARRLPLLRLGGLHLAGSLLVVAASTLIVGNIAMPGADGEADPGEMLVHFAQLLAIAAPVILAFWFAPLLTGWSELPAAKALFFSAVASFRNWRAFAIYGLTVAVVAVAFPGLILIGAAAVSKPLVEILSIALRMVLVFVMAPALMASVYVSFRDVFEAAGDNA